MSKKNYRILVVDDEASILLLLRRIIEDEGYSVATASSGPEAMRVAGNFKPQLILTDLKMPGMDGISFMKKYKEGEGDADFIVLTAFGTIETAIQSMKMGALDYILKPLKEPDELRLAIRKVADRRRLMDENSALKAGLNRDMPPLEVIFVGMEELLDDIRAVAPAHSTVLLLGETGSGKSLIARVIHKLSGTEGPFVEVNCASVPENLLESEFFGHEKGAFTGAISSKKGKFELAMEGILFLDEISEMNQHMQAKLLRVLHDGSFERLGATSTLTTDARIICATNRDLKREVAEGRFREDLFFRLNVFPIRIKPLRERKSHIPLVAEFLMKSISRRVGKNVGKISDADRGKIMSYSWPGNIRELQNVLERAIILSKSDSIELSGVLLDQEKAINEQNETLRDIEKKAICETLERMEGNRRRTAEILGISLRALQYKIKEYGLKN
jgi:DNA-binding NtrC family response regulator